MEPEEQGMVTDCITKHWRIHVALLHTLYAGDDDHGLGGQPQEG